MSAVPLLPNSAPFAEDQIASLNRVMSVTNPEQRSWLSGFLAGFAAGNGQPAQQPAAPPAR